MGTIDSVIFWSCLGLALVNVHLAFIAKALHAPQLQTLAFLSAALLLVGAWSRWHRDPSRRRG